MTAVGASRSPWLAALRRLRRQRAIALGYHGVADTPLREDLNLLQVAPQRFRAQVELMLDAGFRFVTAAELAQQAHSDGAPEPGLAAITFDDGLRNNLTIALPILAAYGVPATVYVTTGFVGGVNPWIGAGGDGAMLDWGEIAELAQAGWEIGAHTLTHPDMTKLDHDASVREIAGSREALERATGVEVKTFAYPFGRYDAGAIAAVRETGLLGAVTTGSGCWRPYELTRAMIGTLDPWPLILLKLADRYEPLLRSAPLSAIRDASKQARDALRGARAA